MRLEPEDPNHHNREAVRIATIIALAVVVGLAVVRPVVAVLSPEAQRALLIFSLCAIVAGLWLGLTTE